MKKILILLHAAVLAAVGAHAETLLADFEDGTTGGLTIATSSTNAALFAAMPTVMDNPDRTGLNTSARCVGATNVAGADWWQNFLVLHLNEPVTIDDSNCRLTMLAYRSIQPKDMRIGIGDHEADAEVWYGKLEADATWERLVIDLGAKFMGQVVSDIVIVLSTNWSDPRSGWGEATYCFDDIMLSAAEAMPTATVTIDTATTYQTIVDFGASDCWTADYVGRYWTSDRDKAARWLFSREMDADGNPEGIGLSTWRVNVGAGSKEQGTASNIDDVTRRAECFLAADGTYDWTKQAGQQWFMQQAKAYGVDHMLLFSNSAPVHFTRNGLANAGGQNLSASNLKDDCYDDFADFLATVAQHFEADGYPIAYIDPVNEPRFDWKDGQEGSPWQNTNIASVVRELDRAIRERGLSARIMMPEASSLDLLYGGTGRAANQIEAFFNRSYTQTYVGDLSTLAPLVAGHSYWTFGTNASLRDVRQKTAEAAARYGLSFIQTEWSMLDAEPSTETGFPSSYDAATYMDIALFMGKLIHCDLVYGGAVGWHYWTAMAQEQWGQKNRFFLLKITPRMNSMLQNGTIEDNPNLWVLGNYSRFVRPGYRRVALDGAAEMNQLLGSAWLSPDGSELVAVFVNTDHGPRDIVLTLSGGTEVASIDKYVTADGSNLRRDRDAQSLDALAVPARSVTTFVMKLGAVSAIDEVRTTPSRAIDAGFDYDIYGRRVTMPRLGSLVVHDGRPTIIR